MTPMAFELLYSTMVDVDEQLGQQEKHSGNFTRNFVGIFVFLMEFGWAFFKLGSRGLF